MIEHGDKKHMRKENIVWERLEAGWCHWKGVDVELEVRSREVCERRVGLDVSCKLSAPWLAILGGRVSSRSIRVRISLSLSLSLPYSRALPLTRSPHGFVHFSEFFPSSILSDLFAIDRGEEELYFVFFFFLFPPVLERNSTLRVRVLFLIILARLVSSFLFFLINNIFHKYFFSFFLRFRFALLYLLWYSFSFFFSFP